MNIIKMIKTADYFTMLNLCSGMLSIFSSVRGSFGLAALFIIIATFFDAIDGKVALWMKQKNLLGKELDSLSDLVSFGVAPAVLYFSMVGEGSILVYIVLLFFVVAGMLRLARYNVTMAKGFEGMPITANGVIFPCLYLFNAYLPNTFSFWPLVFVILGLLMLSTVKVRRIF